MATLVLWIIVLVRICYDGPLGNETCRGVERDIIIQISKKQVFPHDWFSVVNQGTKFIQVASGTGTSCSSAEVTHDTSSCMSPA